VPVDGTVVAGLGTGVAEALPIPDVCMVWRFVIKLKFSALRKISSSVSAAGSTAFKICSDDCVLELFSLLFNWFFVSQRRQQLATFA
jgi:hypothetical protein